MGTYFLIIGQWIRHQHIIHIGTKFVKIGQVVEAGQG